MKPLIFTLKSLCESLLNVFYIITLDKGGDAEPKERGIKVSRERLPGCGTVIMDHLKAMNTNWTIKISFVIGSL